MDNVPEKHRAIAHAWVDGAEIEVLGNDSWRDVLYPLWDEASQYRIKPRKVKKWRWVVRHGADPGEISITKSFYTEEQAYEIFDVVGRDEATMIEKKNDPPAT